MIPFPFQAGGLGLVQQDGGAPPGPSITFVNSDVNNANSTSVTTNVPAGVVNGDLLVFFLFNSVVASVITPPGGLTSKFSDNAMDNGVRVYQRIASSEPASYTFTLGTSSAVSLLIVAYRGATDLSTVGTITRSSSTAASISPGSAGVLLGYYVNEQGTAGVGFTPPTGMTTRASVLVATRNAAVVDLNPSPAGASGSKTCTWSLTNVPAALLFQMT